MTTANHRNLVENATATQPAGSRVASAAGGGRVLGAMVLAAAGLVISTQLLKAQGNFVYNGIGDGTPLQGQETTSAGSGNFAFNGYAAQPNATTVTIISFSVAAGGNGPMPDFSPNWLALTPSLQVWAGMPGGVGSSLLLNHSFGVGGYSSLIDIPATDSIGLPLKEMTFNTSSLSSLSLGAGQSLYVGIGWIGPSNLYGISGVALTTVAGPTGVRYNGFSVSSLPSANGFDIALNYQAVPEPSVLAVVGLGLAGMLSSVGVKKRD